MRVGRTRDATAEVTIFLDCQEVVLTMASGTIVNAGAADMLKDILVSKSRSRRIFVRCVWSTILDAPINHKNAADRLGPF